MNTRAQRIAELVARRPIPTQEVLSAIADAASAEDVDAIPAIRAIGEMSGIYDEMLAVPAITSLAAWGERGLDELTKVALSGHYGDIALRILLHLAQGRPLPSDIADCWQDGIVVDPIRLSDGAWRRLRELVLTLSSEPDLRRRFTHMAAIAFNRPQENEAQDLLWRLLTESPLSLNRHVLTQFELHLSTSASEETTQKFLEENPVLLDATAMEPVAKHKLGSELVTDFVLRQINGDYMLVEIERSTDKLFTSKGRIHHQLTDALAQVRDFQRWVHENIAYARTLLPGVTRPRGLIVIGRSSELTPELRRILDEENYSRRGYVEIATYDDLLERARAIYENLVAPPRARSMRG